MKRIIYMFAAFNALIPFTLYNGNESQAASMGPIVRQNIGRTVIALEKKAKSEVALFKPQKGEVALFKPQKGEVVLFKPQLGTKINTQATNKLSNFIQSGFPKTNFSKDCGKCSNITKKISEFSKNHPMSDLLDAKKLEGKLKTVQEQWDALINSYTMKLPTKVRDRIKTQKVEKLFASVLNFSETYLFGSRISGDAVDFYTQGAKLLNKFRGFDNKKFRQEALTFFKELVNSPTDLKKTVEVLKNSANSMMEVAINKAVPYWNKFILQLEKKGVKDTSQLNEGKELFVNSIKTVCAATKLLEFFVLSATSCDTMIKEKIAKLIENQLTAKGPPENSGNTPVQAEAILQEIDQEILKPIMTDIHNEENTDEKNLSKEEKQKEKIQIAEIQNALRESETQGQANGSAKENTEETKMEIADIKENQPSEDGPIQQDHIYSSFIAKIYNTIMRKGQKNSNFPSGKMRNRIFPVPASFCDTIDQEFGCSVHNPDELSFFRSSAPYCFAVRSSIEKPEGRCIVTYNDELYKKTYSRSLLDTLQQQAVAYLARKELGLGFSDLMSCDIKDEEVPEGLNYDPNMQRIINTLNGHIPQMM